MGNIAKSVEDTVLGEALAGDYQDMLGIVSVIDNRSKATGVSYKDVVSVPSQFNAYGKAMPKGVEAYRDLAKQAIAEVQAKGPVHAATFYATPAAAKGLPKGLAFETKTAGHQYYSDPKGRAIKTAEGYKTPNVEAIGRTAYAPTPEVGPTPQSNPAASAIESLLGVTAAENPARGGLAYKTEAARKGVENFSPEMSKSFANVTRGLTDPSSYTVTSTTEARPGLAGLTHVRDKAAVDVRTRGLEQKALDDLAVAAMYDPAVQALGWDAYAKAPHAHIGVTTPYGKGLQPGSNISKLSPDVQAAMRSWSESVTTGTPFAPMVPEAIAPTPYSGRAPVTAVSRSPLAGLMDVAEAKAPNRGFAGPAVSFAQPGLTTNIDQANLTAPTMTGPASRSVQSVSYSPAGLVAPQDAKGRAASQESKGLAAAMSPVRGMAHDQAYGRNPSLSGIVGNVTTSPASTISQDTMGRMIDTSVAGGVGMANPGFAAGIADMAIAQAQAHGATTALSPDDVGMPDIGMPTQAPANVAAAYQDMAKTMGEVGVMGVSGTTTFDPLQGTVTQQTAPTAPTAPATAPTAPATAPTAATVTAPAAPAMAAHSPAPAQEQQGPLSALAGLLGVENVTKSVGKGLRSNVGKAGMRGAGVGAMFGGIPGGVLGALLGIAMAQHRDPAKTFARSYQSGLGFPEKPEGPSSQGGLTAYGEAASRGDFGGQAQTAADNPGTGLF